MQLLKKMWHGFRNELVFFLEKSKMFLFFFFAGIVYCSGWPFVKIGTPAKWMFCQNHLSPLNRTRGKFIFHLVNVPGTLSRIAVRPVMQFKEGFSQFSVSVLCTLVKLIGVCFRHMSTILTYFRSLNPKITAKFGSGNTNYRSQTDKIVYNTSMLTPGQLLSL